MWIELSSLLLHRPCLLSLLEGTSWTFHSLLRGALQLRSRRHLLRRWCSWKDLPRSCSGSEATRLVHLQGIYRSLLWIALQRGRLYYLRKQIVAQLSQAHSISKAGRLSQSALRIGLAWVCFLYPGEARLHHRWHSCEVWLPLATVYLFNFERPKWAWHWLWARCGRRPLSYSR